jgi:hypothetical protein
MPEIGIRCTSDETVAFALLLLSGISPPLNKAKPPACHAPGVLHFQAAANILILPRQ